MHDEPLGRMPAYGAQHLTMLALIAVGAVIIITLLRRALRDPAADGAAGPLIVRQSGFRAVEGTRADRVLRVCGWALLANSVAWTLWGFMPWAWSLHDSLPLHFSDALRFIGPIALISRRGWAVVVAVFWGLTLNLQSVLTPDVNYVVIPPLEFAEYWIAHGSGLLIPAALLWGLGLRPTWRGFAGAYGATVLWAGIAVTGNALTGANYAYLNRAPAGPSILDLMGPWPRYIAVEALLIAVVWALMTLLWNLPRRPSRIALAPSAGRTRRPR
ncbi:TIGR02206 family membrane protein [Brachybacterium sp. JHP9]|uniref:TIGR02206 family membrane protein n=1 Tax=Brachybacterium equifaecis TaxID=2910770 RepID=A0ABT0QYD4_9MICO|nr:TIGR02206 family membrane protein [Brachybacterium equifaecis]